MKWIKIHSRVHKVVIGYNPQQFNVISIWNVNISAFYGSADYNMY